MGPAFINFWARERYLSAEAVDGAVSRRGTCSLPCWMQSDNWHSPRNIRTSERNMIWRVCCCRVPVDDDDQSIGCGSQMRWNGRQSLQVPTSITLRDCALALGLEGIGESLGRSWEDGWHSGWARVAFKGRLRRVSSFARTSKLISSLSPTSRYLVGISGAPGSGKTTIASEVVNTYSVFSLTAGRQT